MGAADIYTAYKTYGQVPLVLEDYGDGAGLEYYSVAVVKSEFCEGNPTLADLQGMRSCHTGYRKTAGWVVPVGVLVESGVMPVVEVNGVQNDAASVAAFFSETCAPRVVSDGPADGGEKWDELCTGCAGDCSETDPFYDYAGSLKCLADGAGDVAFTKQDTALTDPDKDNYRLLCPNGGCAAVDDFASCNLARVPSHAVIASSELASGPLGPAIAEALVAAAGTPGFLESTTSIDDVENVVFAEGTTGLEAFTGSVEDDYFGQAILQSYQGGEQLTAGASNGDIVRICVPAPPSGPGFVSTCTSNMAAANTANVTFSCVLGESPDACMQMIDAGEAEITSFGAADIYAAYKTYGQVPLVLEDYGDGAGLEYYSVAVVKSEFCEGNPTLADLQGMRSCHTGYRKTAGWVVPVGVLVESGVMPVVEVNGVQNDAASVAAFFSETCAPRVVSDGPADGGEKWDELCTGCAGDCSETDPFYDYAGSLKCLADGAGDVAFTKQDTALTDPDKDNYRLLCPNGGCAAVDDFASCNLARVPSHAVIASSELASSPRGSEIAAALVAATGTPGFLESTTSIDGVENVVFAEGTTGLEAFSGSVEDDYFGQAILQSYQGGEQLTSESSTSDSGGDDLSGGAIAGIVIGCVAGVAILGALGFVIYKKRKDKYWTMQEVSSLKTAQGI